MKFEKHEYIAEGFQLREDENRDSRIVEGYAILFGVRSTIVGYDMKNDIPLYEVIERSALDKDYLDRQDIILNLSHNNDRMLARSVRGKGTLSYEVDDKGVKFRAEMPHTADGDYALEHIRVGNLFNCSFAFTLTRDNYSIEVTKDENGNEIALSHVKSFNSITDMAIVRNGAYSETSVNSRAELMVEDLERMMAQREEQPEIQEDKKDEKNDTANYRKEARALRGVADSAFKF